MFFVHITLLEINVQQKIFPYEPCAFVTLEYQLVVLAWMMITLNAWRRHQTETFSALLALCAGNPPVSGEFPSQRPVTRSFDVIFNLRLNKWLSKQTWGWWFETPSRSFWCHCNGIWVCHKVGRVLSDHLSECSVTVTFTWRIIC